MGIEFALAGILTLFAFTLPARAALKGDEVILGKWSITLETPEAPLTVEVEFQKPRAGLITGTVFGGAAPVTNLRLMTLIWNS